MDAKRELRRAARSMKRMVGMPDAAPRHFDIPDGAKVLVHVGKSGGTTLRHALDQTELGRQMHVVHIMRPPVRPSLEYYIVARGPVSRALSAFNWRYKLVVADGSQKDRVLGVKSEGRLKNHAVEMDNKQLVLEPRAVANLRRFLAPDYACLTRLFCWGKLDKDVFVRTL